MKIWIVSWILQWVISYLISVILLRYFHINIGFLGTFIIGSVISVPIFLGLKKL